MLKTIKLNDVNKKVRTTKHNMLGYISQYVFNLKNGYDVDDVTIDLYYKDGSVERFTDRDLMHMKMPNMSEISNVVYSDAEETFDLYTKNIFNDDEIEILIQAGVIVV